MSGNWSRLDSATGTSTASAATCWYRSMRPQSLPMARTPCRASSRTPSTTASAYSGAPARHASIASPGTGLKITG